MPHQLHLELIAGDALRSVLITALFSSTPHGRRIFIFSLRDVRRTAADTLPPAGNVHSSARP